jgi:LCP family protein required for cell wall assembly
MTVPDPAPETGESTTGHKHPLLRRVTIIIACVMAFVLVAGSLTGYLIYRHLNNNLHVIDVAPDLGPRPSKIIETDVAQQPMNILLMGSDTRVGQGSNGKGKGYGMDVTGARSDTTMLVHLPADRSHALVVSIPRDSIVNIPSCKTSTGMSAPTTDRFNAAFSIGGPACTIKTVESLTNVFIDHYVVVDFDGFMNVVSALGGVDVCLPEAIDDPKSGLNLPKGISTVTGKQALAYVRARYIGNGSDISRIDRQQAFLSSVINKAKSSGTLFNPINLVKFLDAATKSLTLDPGLGSLNKLRQLAEDVRAIPPKDITFMTIPWTYNPADPNTVIWKPQQADKVWNAIRTDKDYPPPPQKPTQLDGKPLDRMQSDINVRVLHGTNTVGAASKVADQLRKQGFNVIGVGNADSSDFVSTVVRYDPTYDDSARTVAASVPGANRVLRAGLGSTIEIVVGADSPTVQPVVVKKPPVPGIRQASSNICTDDLE